MKQIQRFTQLWFVILILIARPLSLYAGDVEAVLSSADASTSFEVQDSGTTVQFRVDSDGNTTWPQGATNSDFTLPTIAGTPHGSVTAPEGSLAFDTTGNALYFNTDSGTTWSAIGSGGGGSTSIGSTITGGTQGSVLFLGAANVLAQDNSNLFWDDTNNRLGIGGDTTPDAILEVAATGAADSDSLLKVSEDGNDIWNVAARDGAHLRVGITRYLNISTDGTSTLFLGNQGGVPDVTAADSLGLLLRSREDDGGAPYGIALLNDIAMPSGVPLLKVGIGTTDATTEYFRIDDSGNVGIGTTSPVTNLNVANGGEGIHPSSAGGIGILIERDGPVGLGIATRTTDEGSIYFTDNTSSWSTGKIAYDHSTDALTFDTAGSERMIIDASGDIGIGTSSPSPSGPENYTAGVVIDMTLGGSNSDPGIWLRGNGGLGLDIWADVSTGDSYFENKWNNDNGDIHFKTKTLGTDVDALTIKGSGNVGIGTTTPGAKLEVNTSTADDGVWLRNSTTNVGRLYKHSSGTNVGRLTLWNNGSNVVDLVGNGDVIFNTGGDVGIGTASPADALHVYDATDSAITLSRAGSEATLSQWTYNGGTVQFGAFAADNLGLVANANEYVTIVGDGGSCVGVNGGVGIGDTCADAILELVDNGSDILNISSAAGNDGDYLTVDTSGNVGIGTTSPATLLHAAGTSNGVTMAIEGGDGALTGGEDYAVLEFRGYDTEFPSSIGARIAARAHTFWSQSALDAPTYLYFYLQTDGTSDNLGSPEMILTQNGLGIGGDVPNGALDILSGSAEGTKLIIDNTAANGDPQINFQLSGTTSYTIGVDDTDSDKFKISTTAPGTNDRIVIDASGNVGIGTSSFGTNAATVLAIANGTAPTSSPADLVQLYAEDVAASSELKVRDEAGNVTTLSPHNYSLFTPDSDYLMPWSFYTRNDEKDMEMNVDMYGLVKRVEDLTGDQLIYTRRISNGEERKFGELGELGELRERDHLREKEIKKLKEENKYLRNRMMEFERQLKTVIASVAKQSQTGIASVVSLPRDDDKMRNE